MSEYGAIRNPQAFLADALRRRTERFNHCFPRGISFGDVDSIVEIGGKFLLVEYKNGDQEVPTGQRKLLERLSRIAGFTVFVLWLDRDGQITHAWEVGDRGKVKCGEADVCRAFQKWVEVAES